MGGEIEWAAVPIFAAMHGVNDIELLIAWLIAIRDGMRNQSASTNG